jgi:hypothetical protein
VGSGKTALVDRLSQRLADSVNGGLSKRRARYRRPNQRHLYSRRCRVSGPRGRPACRARAWIVETRGCPHAEIREDCSMNLEAIADPERTLGSARHRRRCRKLCAGRTRITSLALHMDAFLREYLIRHRGARWQLVHGAAENGRTSGSQPGGCLASPLSYHVFAQHDHYVAIGVDAPKRSGAGSWTAMPAATSGQTGVSGWSRGLGAQRELVR